MMAGATFQGSNGLTVEECGTSLIAKCICAAEIWFHTEIFSTEWEGHVPGIWSEFYTLEAQSELLFLHGSQII